MRSRGFTLLELLMGLALLGLMLLLIYAALNTSLRAWDTGERFAAEAGHDRIVVSFLRRELSQTFPVRWRGIAESRIAFEGDKSAIMYVTALNISAGVTTIGGLQWGHLYLADDEIQGKRMQSVFLRRSSFDTRAKNWDGLDEGKSIRLMENVKSLEIDYFGADDDAAEAKWTRQWDNALRLPQLVRIHIELDTGRQFPDLVIALRLGEEAGCYDTNFQRQCAARPL